MNALIHDLRLAITAALREWKTCRYLRRGGNPDVLPF